MRSTFALADVSVHFDDAPWVDEDSGKEYPTDAIVYAMDQVNEMASLVCCDVDFVEAKLDGEVLADGTGYVSGEVKKCEAQYRAFKRAVLSRPSREG